MASEILMMAEVLSTEKAVDKHIIFEAIEAALATATRKRHREDIDVHCTICLLYTSPSPRDRQKSRMPSSA